MLSSPSVVGSGVVVQALPPPVMLCTWAATGYAPLPPPVLSTSKELAVSVAMPVMVKDADSPTPKRFAPLP